MMLAMNWEELQSDLRQRMRDQPRGFQTQLAQKLGVAQPSVAAYMTGRKEIPTAHLTTILDVLGLQVELTPKPRNS